MHENNGWFAADSAPKDGTWFMIVDKQGGMAWSPYEFAYWEKQYGDKGYFAMTDTSEVADFDWWRPLPELPIIK